MSKIALSGNASGTGTLTLSAPNTNSDRAIALPDAAGTIALQGGAISGTTGTFTGLLDISAAGAGQIQFPATQNASSNANTLDDYEEGTWTTTTASTVNISGITLQQARYTKVGRMVTIDGYFDATIASANTLTYFSFTIPFPLISTTVGGCGAAVTNNEFAPGSVYRASGSTSLVYIFFKASVGFGSGANALYFTYTYQTT